MDPCVLNNCAPFWTVFPSWNAPLTRAKTATLRAYWAHTQGVDGFFFGIITVRRYRYCWRFYIANYRCRRAGCSKSKREEEKKV